MHPQAPSLPSLPTSSLPVAQLESLKFKANQIIESIQALQRTIEAGYTPSMPAWPDILSKYNILLSQTHNFSNSLVGPATTAGDAATSAARLNGMGLGGMNGLHGVNGAGVPQSQSNPYERIALHPSKPMTDTQLDNEVIPLLRNQQTLDVLRMENDTVRRLAEHMSTRGSIGVLSGTSSAPSTNNVAIQPFGGGFGGGAAPKKVEYPDVLRECAEIAEAHDRRVERAVRAVMMLREKFDWKQRVEVEVEEPEELAWDPRMGMGADANADALQVGEEDEDEGLTPDGESPDGDEGDSDEDEVEGHLVEESATPGGFESGLGTPGVFGGDGMSMETTAHPDGAPALGSDFASSGRMDEGP